METNLVITPIIKAVSLDWNSIFVIWGPALLGLVLAGGSYLKARAAQITNELTSKKVDEVSVKVDGQHTALIAKTDAQTAQILGLNIDKATLSSQKHSAEIATALAASPMAAPAPVPVKVVADEPVPVSIDGADKMANLLNEAERKRKNV